MASERLSLVIGVDHGIAVDLGIELVPFKLADLEGLAAFEATPGIMKILKAFATDRFSERSKLSSSVVSSWIVSSPLSIPDELEGEDNRTDRHR